MAPISVTGTRRYERAAGTVIDPATAAGVQPVGQTGYTLQMSEEFAGAITVTNSTTGRLKFRSDGLEWGAWYANQLTSTPHTNNPPREKEYYDLSAISLSGSSSLLLTATRDFAHSADGLDYTSGLVHSNPSFNFKYGYAEARCRTPNIAGLWSAFWMIPASYTWPPEVDILEQFGVASPVITTWQNSNGAPGSLNMRTYNTDGSTYHVYGCKWTSTALTFYLDGVQVAQETVTTNVPQEPLYVVLNLAVDGNQTINTAAFPQAFEVDYVRVWQ